MIVITNSIKYTLQGGIDIKVKNETKNVIFEIIDTGIGIDKTKNVFEPFNGLKTSSNKEAGFGFRLSLCSELIHLLGGSMEVKSFENKGTEFTFKIPFYLSEKEVGLKYNTNFLEDKTMTSIFASKYVATPLASCIFKPPLELKKKESSIHKNLEDLTVLLVDDTAANIFVLKHMLMKMGIKFDTASNGKEAVEKTLIRKKNNFGLILMDLNMPVMNGIDATLQIKEAEARDQISDIPIIMLSAQGDDQIIKDAMSAGVLEFIEKPISRSKLESSLKKQGFAVK